MANIKRGIVLAVLTYICSFIVGLASAEVIGFDPMASDAIPTNVWIVGIFSTVILMAIATMIYFKDKNIVPSAKEGLQFGFVVFVVSFIIDLSIVIPSIVLSHASPSILHYYINPFFWIIVLALLVTSMYVGHYLETHPTNVGTLPNVPKKRKVSRKKRTSKTSSTKNKKKKKRKRKKK